MRWYQIVLKMIAADPAGVAVKLVRLAMLVAGAASIILSSFGVDLVADEGKVQTVIGSLVTAIALAWSFKNDAKLQQEKPLK
jgi:hypothetical protein